jgi:hypothetical protein
MGDVTLLVVAAVWLALLGFGALVIRRELQLLQDRVRSIGRTPMDGLAVGSFAPRVPGLARDDVVLFLFGDCAPCHEIVDTLGRSLWPDRFLCVVNDGTIPGSDESVLANLPGEVRRVSGSDARAALERFQVHSAPFGVAVVGGLVVAKGTLRDASELDVLLHAVDGRKPLPISVAHSHDHDHEPVA